MVEAGDALWTWALPDLPQPGVSLRVERLPDHRKLYLEYEGAISGGRGTVHRWDRGICQVTGDIDRGLTLILAGEKLSGTMHLTRSNRDAEPASAECARDAAEYFQLLWQPN